MYHDSMFSVDRLVEFGLGIAMARQMVDMFNKSMSQTQSVEQQPTEPIFYVSVDNKPVGPLNEKQLFRLYDEDKLSKDTLGWIPGMPAWKPIEQIPSMLKIFAVTSYYYHQNNY